MSVPLVAVRSALELALYNMATTFPTAWQNRDYTPVVGTAYQEVLFEELPAGNPTMGDGHYRLNAMMTVVLHYPDDNSGTGVAANKAAAICALFKRSATFTDSGIVVKMQKSPHTARGQSIGGWWILPVYVPVYADIFN